jgi:hypothetical protein
VNIREFCGSPFTTLRISDDQLETLKPKDLLEACGVRVLVPGLVLLYISAKTYGMRSTGELSMS